MPTNNNVELWNEIREQAFERTLDLATELIGASLGEDGEAYGDRPLSRGNRILRFQMDAQSGALDILKVQSPRIYEDYVKQYLRDISETPLVKPAPVQRPSPFDMMGGM